MRKLAAGFVVAWVAWLGCLGIARAEVSVQVLDTDPRGEVVELGSNQNFYLRIGFSTDQPVRIWTEPYFRGRAVNAGSSPSDTHTGTGEALGWFFFMQAGDSVDEIRIRAGDGTTQGTHVVATYPVRITGSAQPVVAHAEPAWVVEMKQRGEARQRAAYEQRMNTPASVGETAFFSGFMLLMLGIGIVGLAGPAWGIWRWRGAWRIAAAVPAMMMAFVVLRLIAETSSDSTSHNLWPFEILMIGALSVAIMVVLLVSRRMAGVGR